MRGNILASIFGTVVGNPLTFPLIATGSLWFGRFLLGRSGEQSNFSSVTHAFAEAFNSLWATMQSLFGYGPSMVDGLVLFLDDVFLPYLIGGFAPGLLSAVVSYWIIGPIVAAYQVRRRRKLAKQATRVRREAFAAPAAYRGSDDKEVDDA